MAKPNLFRESFVPVVLVLLGLFALLAYVQFKVEFDASRVTVIEIASHHDTPDGFDETAQSIELLTEDASDNAAYQEALGFMDEGKLAAAEKKLEQVIAGGAASLGLNGMGILRLKQGDPDTALTLFTEALNAKPIHASAYFHRGVAYAKQGLYDKSADDYRSLIRLIPYHYEAHYNLGLALIKMGNNADAISIFEKAKTMAGGERKARTLYNLGIAYRNTGTENKPKAAEAFEQAIRIAPTYIEPRFGLASLEPPTAEGNKRALTQYQKVLDLQPNHAPAYFRLGMVYADLKDKKAAIKAYEKAVGLDPSYIVARYNLGLLLMATKARHRANEQFARILELEPEHARSRFNLGRVAYGLKHYDEAIAEYRQALELRQGDYPEAQLNIGLTHVAKKDYTEAVTAYKQAIGSRLEYPQAWYNLGLAYKRMGLHKEAEDALLTAIKYDAAYEQAWFNLGSLYAGQDRNDESIAAYKQALSIRPDYRGAQLNLAVRYARLGRYEDAVALYKEVLARHPKYAAAWLNIGIAYRELQRYDLAEHALRRRLELEDDSIEARRVLAIILLMREATDEALALLAEAVDMQAADANLRLEFAQALKQAGRNTEARDELEKAQRLAPDNKAIIRELEIMDQRS